MFLEDVWVPIYFNHFIIPHLKGRKTEAKGSLGFAAVTQRLSGEARLRAWEPAPNRCAAAPLEIRKRVTARRLGPLRNS